MRHFHWTSNAKADLIWNFNLSVFDGRRNIIRFNGVMNLVVRKMLLTASSEIDRLPRES